MATFVRVVIFVLGVLTGLAFSRIPHYIDNYAVGALPPPYTGPKFRTWQNGVAND